MSDSRGTQPLDRDEVVLDTERSHSEAADGPAMTDPVARVKDPDTGAKLLLGIAAVTLLNLILLLLLLAQGAGGGSDTIMVEGQPCVVAAHEGTDTLFCARGVEGNGGG